MVGPSWCRSLRLLFLAHLLILAAAAVPPSPRAPEPYSAEAHLARMCDSRITHPRSAPPLTLCRGLRHHHHHHHRRPPVPLPPPGRGGEEEIDLRYGVSKRLVPTGPNPLHN